MRRTPVVFAVTALLMLSGCSSDDSTVSLPPASSGPTGTALTIERFAYSPTPFTVAPGATILVTNNDGAQHTVTSDTKGVFQADAIKKGTPASFRAPITAGTYTFFCEYHSNMHGTLIVR